jgi:hypothetical protein
MPLLFGRPDREITKYRFPLSIPPAHLEGRSDLEALWIWGLGVSGWALAFSFPGGAATLPDTFSRVKSCCTKEQAGKMERDGPRIVAKGDLFLAAV